MGAGAGATLTVDLDALVGNWRALRDLSRPAACAAVVKADAYGLGIEKVGAALRAAGCRRFFVARLDEGVALRAVLGGGDAIYVLDGPASARDAPVFEAAGLVPVLNTPGQVAAWRGRAVLAVDTGMNRLGLSPDEVRALAADPDGLRGVALEFVMSHLACAEDRADPMNERQRLLFDELRALLPRAPASLANSGGVFLGAPFHHALTRPGAAIYGVSAATGAPAPMRPVVGLKAEILQVRTISEPSAVGYGAARRAAPGTRLAVVAAGYADGLPRSLGERGCGYLGGTRVPVAGRISMDLTTFDVTGAPEDSARPGGHVELLSGRRTVDDLAAEAGTIGYEILTALGRRYRRRYEGAAA